jgi:hypothetical protein
LKNNYRFNSQIEIHKINFLDESLPSADVGLFLWAEICNLTPDERKKVIRKFGGNVETLIIDSLIPEEYSNANYCDEGKLIFELDFGTLVATIPDVEEIRDYSRTSFDEFKTLVYYTENFNKRRLYIMRK